LAPSKAPTVPEGAPGLVGSSDALTRSLQGTFLGSTEMFGAAAFGSQELPPYSSASLKSEWPSSWARISGEASLRVTTAALFQGSAQPPYSASLTRNTTSSALTLA